jgi:hypothetical protein
MPSTPDFLRGAAVAQVVGIMHNCHEGGSWSLVDVTTINRLSIMTFKVGMIYPESTTDDRQIIEITVEEKDSGRP